jgi:hypothetical protein
MYLSIKGNYMNNINTLKNTLGIINNADKHLRDGMALYQVKSLFDGLMLADAIDFDSQYGEFLKVFLSTKRKDTAAKNIIYARSIIQAIIKEQEDEQANIIESEKEENKKAIDSTCIVVTSNEKEELITTLLAYKLPNETQLQLNDIPKTLGRPKSPNALSGAQRAKRARHKKKMNEQVLINTTLSKEASKSYSEMKAKGYDLNMIIKKAYENLAQ